MKIKFSEMKSAVLEDLLAWRRLGSVDRVDEQFESRMRERFERVGTLEGLLDATRSSLKEETARVILSDVEVSDYAVIRYVLDCIAESPSK